MRQIMCIFKNTFWPLLCLMLVRTLCVGVHACPVCPCVCFLRCQEHVTELRMAGPQLCENLIAFISQTAWPSQCLTLDMHYTWSLTWPDPSAPSLWYILSLRSPEPCNLRPTDTRLASAAGDQGWNYTLSPCLQNTKECCIFDTDCGHFVFIFCYDIVLHWTVDFIALCGDCPFTCWCFLQWFKRNSFLWVLVFVLSVLLM